MKRRAAAAGSSTWKAQPHMLAQMLGAAQSAGVSTDDSAAAMRASARQPSEAPVRNRVPTALLHPSTHTVMSVGAAVLGDHEVRFGAQGDTPLVSPAGSEDGSQAGSAAEEEEDEDEDEDEEGEDEEEEEEEEEEDDVWED